MSKQPYNQSASQHVITGNYDPGITTSQSVLSSGPTQPYRHDQRAINALPGYCVPVSPGFSDIMAAIQTLAGDVTKLGESQVKTDEKIQKVSNSVETSHALLSNNIATRFKKMSDRVGKQDGSLSTVAERLGEIECSLQELLERARDPLADVLTRPQRDMAVSTEHTMETVHKSRKIGVGVATAPSVSSADVSTSPTKPPKEKSHTRSQSFSVPTPPAKSHPVVVPQNAVASTSQLQPPPAGSPSTRLVHAAQWNTKGVNPLSSSPSSIALTSKPVASSLLKLPALLSPTRPGVKPARNLEDGTIASLRKAALGDHLFVRPLEDKGLTRLDPATIPSLDKQYPPTDRPAFPSPQPTPSPGLHPAELLDGSVRAATTSTLYTRTGLESIKTTAALELETPRKSIGVAGSKDAPSNGSVSTSLPPKTLKQRQRNFLHTLNSVMIAKNTPLPPAFVGVPNPQYDPNTSPWKGLEIVTTGVGVFQLAGTNVDLFKLWGLVFQAGGHAKLTRLNAWSSLLPRFGLPEAVVMPRPDGEKVAQPVAPMLQRYYQAILGGSEESYRKNVEDQQRKMLESSGGRPVGTCIDISYDGASDQQGDGGVLQGESTMQAKLASTSTEPNDVESTTAAPQTPAREGSVEALPSEERHVQGWMSPLSSVASSSSPRAPNPEMAMKRELGLDLIPQDSSRSRIYDREGSMSSLPSLDTSRTHDSDEEHSVQSEVRRTKRKSNQTPAFSSKRFKQENGRGSSTSKTTSREMSSSVSRGLSCVWPRILKRNIHREQIQCNRCNLWYHCGCVGVAEGDIRLQEDEEFVCPPCMQSCQLPTSKTRRNERTCYRPGCNKRQPKDEFFVKRFIGRRLVGERSLTASDEHDWLVQWLGYPVNKATWEPERSLGARDFPALVAKFQEDAMAEGTSTDPDEQVLLKVAVNGRPTGGW